jgi:ParB/RepB/Spo0J family partition protein
MLPPMSQVDQLQDAEQHVAQRQEAEARAQRAALEADLRQAPLADTATHAHTAVEVPLAHVRTMVNMRSGLLPDVHELAVSIKETGLLHPPLVRATGDEAKPYELLAGRRRFAAMQLVDAAEGPREDWRFTLIDGISRREALTMQFAENFHQRKPEPVQFARAARAIMAEDETLSAADVSRMVGAPLAWTRKSLRLLDLPDSIVERVEQGDLSFTVAEIVRKGIARGDVSAAEAAGLVEEHAVGKITGGSLKLGVGYVPPKPKDYEEQSRKLDEARWAAGRAGGRVGDDAEQREWQADGRPEGSRSGEAAGGTGRPRAAGARRSGAAAASPEDLDGYLLGVLIERVASPERRAALGVTADGAAQEYAFALAPHERLGVLRLLAEELLDADPSPPRALQALLAA